MTLCLVRRFSVYDNINTSRYFPYIKTLQLSKLQKKRSYGIPVVGGWLTTRCNGTHLFSRPSSGQRHCPRKRGICLRRDPWRGYDDFDPEWCARAPSIRAGLPGLCSPPVTTGRWSPRESTPVRHNKQWLIESVLCTWYWRRTVLIAVMRYRMKSSNLLRIDECMCALSSPLQRRSSDVAYIVVWRLNYDWQSLNLLALELFLNFSTFCI